MNTLDPLNSEQVDITTNDQETYMKVFLLKPPQPKGFNPARRTQDEAIDLFVKHSYSNKESLDELAIRRRANWGTRDEHDVFSHKIDPQGLMEPCCTVLNKSVSSYEKKWILRENIELCTRRTSSYRMGFWRVSTYDYKEKGKIFHRDFSVNIETRDETLSFKPETNEQTITHLFGKEFYFSWKRKVLGDLSSLRTCLDAARTSMSNIHWSTTCSERSLRLLKEAEVPCRGKNAFLVPAKYLPQPRHYCIFDQIKENMIEV